MNRSVSFVSLRAIVLCLLVGAMPGAWSATVSTPLQQRIDALLKQRLKPEPLPITPPNPFQMTGSVKRESAQDDTPAKPTPRDDVTPAPIAASDNQAKELAANQQSEVLISCATRLKLGGVIILKDQIQIVVNGVPRREGDTVAADWNNAVVYLKITRLLPGQMVLKYGDAEATVKF